jgi:transposase
MLSLPASIRIFIATEPVDFRKAHDGLVATVRDRMAGDPFDGSVFVFTNKRRDRIKLLLWDRNGFWLLYKRLERGTFRWLESSEGMRAEISRAQLSMLLEGIDLEAGKIRSHFAEGIRIESRRAGHVANADRVTG